MEGDLTKDTPVRVICNPSSGGGDRSMDSLRAVLDGYDAQWIETESYGDATEAAREWREGLLVVVGGDGTINEVVNGLGTAGFPEEVTLGILPAGTGNDLAATLAIPEEPEAGAEVIRRNRVRKLDAARVRSEGVGERFFVNVATGGFGAEISGAADEQMKTRWGKLAYLRASLEIARSFEVLGLSLELDGEEREVRAVNVAVGNCRYTGGGWLAAPEADPEDGLLDLVVIEDVSLREMLALTPEILSSGDYLGREGVYYARAETIRIFTNPSKLEFTVDGETIGDEPVEFSAVPQSLKVIVGEQYTPRH